MTWFPVTKVDYIAYIASFSLRKVKCYLFPRTRMITNFQLKPLDSFLRMHYNQGFELTDYVISLYSDVKLACARKRVSDGVITLSC